MTANPGTIFLVAVATWLPLVLFVIGCIMATRILSQQNVFQRYEWYWMKVTGRLRIGLVGASGIAIVLAIYSTWRILQVWALRPIKSQLLKHTSTTPEWWGFVTQYMGYTVTTMVLFLLAGLLLTPLVIVAGRHMYLWKLKFRRSSIADVVGLELTEQAIQRRSAVDKAAEYGIIIDSKLNEIRPGKNVVHAPLKTATASGNVYAFAAIVPRMLTASNQQNPHWQYKDLLIVPQKPGNARAIIIAESGSGKTELLTSVMVSHHAQNAPIILIDGKGDQSDAEKMKINHGAEVHNGGYDFFAGEKDDILERLMKLIPTTESTTFYADEARGVIHAVLDTWEDSNCADMTEFKIFWDIAVAEEQEKVAEEATEPYLTEKVQGTQRHRRVWDTLQKGLSQVETFHHDQGWSIPQLLDQGGMHVIPIVAEDEADVLLANLLIHDLRRYLATKKRRQESVPGVMIIDEFAQIVRENLSEMPAPKMAASLFETTRSLNMGLYIAGQSLAAIAEDQNMQKRLMTAGAALIVGRGKDPETEANAFGTVFHAESSGEASGSSATSTRAQHTYRVSPEWIRTLPNGVFYFAQRGAVRQIIVLPA